MRVDTGIEINVPMDVPAVAMVTMVVRSRGGAQRLYIAWSVGKITP